MKHLLFTVYDEKAEVFTPPFFVPTLGIATRAFADCINSDEHQFGKHPADYTLFQLGSFDDHDALLEHVDKQMLGNGVEFIQSSTTKTFEGMEHEPTITPVQPDKDSGNSPLVV